VPLGDAQIKNLTDRVNMLASTSKSVTLNTYTTSGGTFARMSDLVNIPLANRTGQEWSIEITGNGNWGGTAGTLVIDINGVGIGGQCQMQIGSGDTGPDTAGFDWRAKATITGKSAAQVICHLSVVVSSQNYAEGAAVERTNNQVAQAIAANAFIEMAIVGGGQADTDHGVYEQYGG
jgi:hypothetical protein